MIKDIISKLDVVLAQVLIETIIMDVTLSDGVSLGVSYLQGAESSGRFTGQGGLNNVGFLSPNNFSTATNGAAASTNAFVITRTVEPPRFGSRWTQITLDDAARRQVGDVTAWRATLVREGRELASTQSFLW